MILPKLKSIHFSIHDASSDPSCFDLAVVVVDEQEIKENSIQSEALCQLDLSFQKSISEIVAFGDFKGKWLQTSSVMITAKNSPAKRIVLLGTGQKQDLKPARARQLGIKIAEIVKPLNVQSLSIQGSSCFLAKANLVAQISNGISTGAYKYTMAQTTAEDRNELEKPLAVSFVLSTDKSETVFRQYEEHLQHAGHIQESINLCRLLQDGPPNIVTPKYVAEVIEENARNLKLQVQIFGAQKLREMGFGAMMAVAGGSANEPQFVIVSYEPENFQKTIAFVGKGITMDTGGYSLKIPSTIQEGMKYDMSGAAVSLTSVLAIAKAKLPVRVHAIAALCENMVDAHSYRVGDIVTGYSGKTIEILNTDAEGRVILSDALSYTTKNLKPDALIELSTLTGAMITTLGHVGAGVFATDADLEKIVVAAAEETGERIHAFPVWEEIAEDMRGSISDLCNISATRSSAGSMSAAAFLNHFVENTPFAHIDIAGVSDGNKAIGYVKKGSSGYGVQLCVEIAKRFL